MRERKLIKKCQIDDLVIDFDKKTVFKNNENQNENLQEKFRDSKQAWDALQYIVTYSGEFITQTYLRENVMKGPPSSNDLPTRAINSLIKCGLNKELFQSEYNSDFNDRCYRFTGKYINLDIEEDRLAYFKKLYSELKFPIRDQSKEQYRKLWDFYVNPSFKKIYEDAYVESPFSEETVSKSVIISPSGVGKTTLLESVALLCIEKFVDREDVNDYSEKRLSEIRNSIFGNNSNVYVPVYIKAKKIRKDFETFLDAEGKPSARSLLDFAEAWNNKLKDICDEAKSEGSLLVLIDAVDEIGKDVDKEFFYKLLVKHLGTYENTKIIITSRFVDGAIKNIIENFNFRAFRLCNFQKNDVIRLIELNKDKLNEDKIKAIKERLENDVNFEKFLSNAYCASVMLADDKDFKDKYAGRVEEISKNILKFRCKEDADSEDLSSCLKKLAWSMIKENKTDGIRYREFLRILTSETKKNSEETIRLCENDDKAKKMIKDLSQISGILDQYLDSTNTVFYFFQSELLMYCYAASYVIDCLEVYDEESAGVVTYNYIQSLMNTKTVPGVEVLIFAIALAEFYGNQNCAFALFNYLISKIIFFDTEKSKELADGLKKLLDRHYGITIVNKSKWGSECDDSVYKKICEDILLEFNK